MYRIIVADDEPIERKVVEKIINKHLGGQLQVIPAVNGREAVELYEKEDCRIALLDIEMPGVNGLEAAEMIRSKDKNGSIVFLTAFDEFSYAKRAIGVRALDYLLKPVAVEELVDVLEEAIRLAQEQDEAAIRSAREQDGGVGEAGGMNHSEQSTQAYGSPRWVDAKASADVTKSNADDRKEILNGSKANPEKSTGENEFLADNLRMNVVAESIRIYIENHYMEEIALQDVAAAMNYSDAYFCKLFKQCFDKSFVSYLTLFRMEKAKDLLSDVLTNVKDVGAEVGYKDSNYFTKVFKRLEGMTPTEYRKQILQNGEEK